MTSFRWRTPQARKQEMKTLEWHLLWMHFTCMQQHFHFSGCSLFPLYLFNLILVSTGADPPGGDVTALLHEGPQWEPQGIEDAKVIGRVRGCLGVFGLILFLKVPLVRTEPTDQEQDHAHPNIGKHYTHPDLIGQRIQEGEHARLRLLRLLYHNGDAQAHKGLGKVYHLLSN